MSVRIRFCVLTALSLAGCSHAAKVSEPGRRIDYAYFQVLKPDGTELWHYNSFLVHSVEGQMNVTESYLDSPEPAAALSRTLDMKTRMLPDGKTAINEGMSMDVAVEGYSRTENLPDGRKEIALEKNFANWWTSTGKTIVEKDGSMTGRLELRNKAGELVSTYIMQSHPATPEERELWQQRKEAALHAAPRKEEVIDYRLKTDRSTYPGATTDSSAR